MLKPPRAGIHQGAVYAGVPLVWVTAPLWIMRPKAGTYDAMQPRRADEVADAFVGADGREVVLAQAKARPVVVLSNHAELRRLRQARVVPLYSYNAEGGVARLRLEIERGRVGAAFHLSGDTGLRIYDGALRLDQMQPVDSEFLSRQVASMSDRALAALLDHAVRYLRTLDRRPVA